MRVSFVSCFRSDVFRREMSKCTQGQDTKKARIESESEFLTISLVIPSLDHLHAMPVILLPSLCYRFHVAVPTGAAVPPSRCRLLVAVSRPRYHHRIHIIISMMRRHHDATLSLIAVVSALARGLMRVVPILYLPNIRWSDDGGARHSSAARRTTIVIIAGDNDDPQRRGILPHQGRREQRGGSAREHHRREEEILWLRQKIFGGLFSLSPCWSDERSIAAPCRTFVSLSVVLRA